jgi:uncharacterized membrane protein
MKFWKPYYSTGFAALFLESWAAYFSVFGLVAMFGKSFMGAAIAIEFFKIVMVAYLYNWRKETSKILKWFLFTVVIGSMILTSIGVYGFMTNSYQQKQGKIFGANAIKTKFNSQNIDLSKNEIKMYEDQIAIAKERLKTLNSSRATQEKRLSDSMTTLNYKFINSLRADISKSDSDIAKTSDEISNLISKIQQKNTEVGKIQQDNFQIEQTNDGVDVGPLRWIGVTLGKSMDGVINFLIFFIMFLLDPAAIAALLSANNQLAKTKNKPDKVDEKANEKEERKKRREERREKRRKAKTDLERIFYEDKK